MLSQELIYKQRNDFGIFETERLLLVPNNDNLMNSSDYLNWLSPENVERSTKVLDNLPRSIQETLFEKNKQTKRSLGKGHKKKGGNHKIKKYIHKILKGKKKKKKYLKKKIMYIFFGILAAKSILMLLVLKTIALIAAKVLIMGFFSTLMSTIVGLKGMFGHSYYGHRSRKDDANTRLEIVHIPPKDDYYGRPYKRKDLQNTLSRGDTLNKNV